MDKNIITIFTDPMMGLTYECEPIYDKLKEHYGDALEFKYIMAGLVRDVSEFMNPDELALPAKEGIRKYNVYKVSWHIFFALLPYSKRRPKCSCD